MNSRITYSDFFNILLVLIFLISTNQVSAEEINNTFNTSIYSQNCDIEKIHRKFIFVQLYDDINFLLHQPSFYGVVGGLTLTPKLFQKGFDTEEPEFTEMWVNSQLADNLFEMGEVFGDSKFPFALSAVSWGLGKLKNSKQLKSFGADLFRAQIFNGIFCIAIKGAINRPRPNGAPYSYPSGHSSTAFATAGVVYKHFGKNFGIPAFIVAGYVGFSRLQENKHYLTDIIAGGILGSYISLKLAHNDKQEQSFAITPFMTNNSKGLSLTTKF